MNTKVNPKMIELARESRGINQSELSNRLGISQGKLSKIENGILPVDEVELEALTTELHYPQSFFFRFGEVYGVGLSEMFHRKRQSVPKNILIQIYALIEVRRMQISQLLKAVDFGDLAIFSLDPDKYDGNINLIAQTVRSAWRIPKGPINNLITVIENAGAIVIPFDFFDAKIEAISIKPVDLPPLIFVNWNRSMDRIRFTLAHELGHLIMHDVPPSDPSVIEHQADQFASEFLMPSQEISHQLANFTLSSLPNLKLYWKTSMSSIVMKAKDLGKISDRQARSIWVKLSQAGYKTREPEHLDPPMESPKSLQNIIKLYINDLNYSPSDLAKALDLFENEAMKEYLQPKRHLRAVN